MKTSRHSFAYDAAFLGMLVLLFICVAFMTAYSDETVTNLILFTIVCVVMAVAFFTSVTAGLVIDIVLIFGGASWLLYRFFAEDIEPGSEAYFWIVLLVLLTICSGLMARGKRNLETENIQFHKEIEKFATIDDLTGLKNINAFESELSLYVSIAQRNRLSVALLVMEFRYAGELKAYLGADRLKSVSVKLSQIIGSSLRGGDTVYLLSKKPYRWGALLLLKPVTAQIVVDRVKTRVASVDFSAETNLIQPEIRIGAGEATPGDTPEQVLDRALRQMEYDV